MVDRIDPNEAARRMEEDGYAYLDVRTVGEFEQGHPEGAYNIPVMVLGAAGMEANARFVELVAATFARDAKLIVGCKAGRRSLHAAKLLETAGFTGLVDQRAGWDGERDAFGEVIEPGWARRELPRATNATVGRSYAELGG